MRSPALSRRLNDRGTYSLKYAAASSSLFRLKAAAGRGVTAAVWKLADENLDGGRVAVPPALL